MKTGYKHTEVGVIPEDWEVKRLGDLGNVVRGGSPRPAGDPRYFDGHFIPWLTVAALTNIPDHQLEVTETATYLTQEGSKHSRTLAPETLIIANSGATLGVAKLLKTTCCANDGIAAIINQRLGEKRFVSFYINTQIKKLREVVATGNGQPNLNTGLIREIAIPFPPPSEQRAIAEALSDMDALLGGLERLIAKKRDLKQAAMQQILTGQTRLKGFGPTKSLKRYVYGLIPEDWNTLPFSKISTMNGRIGWQGLKQEEFTDNPDDPFLITGMNFKDGRIRWNEVYHIPTKRYREAPAIQLRRDDVLITKDGTIGKLLFVDEIPHPGMASLNSHLLVFRPIDGQYFPKFLFYQLGSPPFAQHIELHKSGSTFFGLTQAATGKYPVVLPPVPEQTAIAEMLTEMDAELVALAQRREKTRALKQAMMQELLTGRTRLVSPRVTEQRAEEKEMRQ